MRLDESSCDCPVATGCKHARRCCSTGARRPPRQRATDPEPSRDATTPPAWQRALDAALGSAVAAPRGARLRLQLEVMASPRIPARAPVTYRLGAAPSCRSTTGRWLRTGSPESMCARYAHRFDPRHTTALSALHALAGAGSRAYGSYYLGQRDGSPRRDRRRGRGRLLDDIRYAGCQSCSRAPTAPGKHSSTRLHRRSWKCTADGRGLRVAARSPSDGETDRPGSSRADRWRASPTGAYWWSADDDAEPVAQETARLTLAHYRAARR